MRERQILNILCLLCVAFFVNACTFWVSNGRGFTETYIGPDGVEKRDCRAVCRSRAYYNGWGYRRLTRCYGYVCKRLSHFVDSEAGTRPQLIDAATTSNDGPVPLFGNMYDPGEIDTGVAAVAFADRHGLKIESAAFVLELLEAENPGQQFIALQEKILPDMAANELFALRKYQAPSRLVSAIANHLNEPEEAVRSAIVEFLDYSKFMAELDAHVNDDSQSI